MSKLAKKPISIPEGLAAAKTDGDLEFKGPAGSRQLKILDFVNVEIKDKQLIMSPTASHKQARANLGTMAALIKNAIAGVREGFVKILELEGIGFRASMEGDGLVLNVGFTHPVKFTPPAGIKIAIEKNRIKISGIDKELVGQAAANIRKIKKPEPYKGTGIHYLGEVIRRKAGKKAAVGAAAAGGPAAS